MAEVFLLRGVLVKLAGFTVEKILEVCGLVKAIENIQSLSEITDEVENLKKELSSIQMLIEDADKRSIVDKTKKKWVMDLIEIAYQIEDALDIFFLECPTKLSGITKLPKKISKVPFLWNFQKKMVKIQKSISRIHEYGETYNPKNLGENTKRQNKQSDSGIKLDPIGDPEVVGFDEDIKNVVNNLCDETFKRLAVVSIVGPGGLGKTTLARKVCYSEKVMKEFGESAWITISQNYNLLGILKKIAKGFDVESTSMDANELANKVRNYLARIKYLIVLDDVWTKELFAQLKTFLPDANNGSRVLITTRLAVDVARYADTTYEPYEPKLLNENQSLDLFIKNAIPKRHQHLQGLSDGIKELAKKFVNKCNGLPLALIQLGLLLSTKPCKDDEWEKMLATMSWQDDRFFECMKVIATSFEHLPFVKKFCFMYFAAFPKDERIEAQSLLKIWIAEGLIPPEEQTNLEQTAHHFLEDLVQRGMVQAAERDSDGSIKYLCVHDIMRNLAIQKAKENKFLVVCSKRSDWESPYCKEARRIAIHYSDFDESMLDHGNRNLRSLLIFGQQKLDCSKYKLLRVVLAKMDKEVPELKSFSQLRYLKYLQLNNKCYFGEWINAQGSLENLDPGSTSHEGMQAIEAVAKKKRARVECVEETQEGKRHKTSDGRSAQDDVGASSAQDDVLPDTNKEVKSARKNHPYRKMAYFLTKMR